MSCQSHRAAWVREFAGEVSLFPATQGRGIHLLRNTHTAETHPTLRVGVPVGRVHEARIRIRPTILCERADEQFAATDHEYERGMGITLPIQVPRLRITVTEEHQPRLCPAPPGDQSRCSGQNIFGQNLGCHACAQAFPQRFEKPCRDRLAGAQVWRFVRPALHLMYRGECSIAVLIDKNGLLQGENSVVSNSHVDIHTHPSRVITPSSFPGIRSIRRLAAANVLQTTATVRKPSRTLLASLSLIGMMTFGCGVTSSAVSPSSSKHPTTASPVEKAASRQGNAGFESMSCSPMSSVNSGRLACLETRHNSSKPVISARTCRSRTSSLIFFNPQILRGRSVNDFGVHPSTSGSSYCSAFSSPSYHSCSISTRSSASW